MPGERPPPLPRLRPVTLFPMDEKSEPTWREGMTRDPRDQLIDDLRRTVDTLKTALHDEAEAAPETRPSLLMLQRQHRLAVAKNTAKGIAVLLLPVLGGVVAKHWPEYSVFVDWASSLVGL